MKKFTFVVLFLLAGSGVVAASQSTCAETKKEVQKQLATANFCKSDADCAISTAFSCSLGEAYHLFNARVNLSNIEEKVKAYQRACDVPDCQPLPPPAGELRCVTGACAFARTDRAPTLNQELRVTIDVDKTHYFMGDAVTATIRNNSDKDIWLAPVCGGGAFANLYQLVGPSSNADWKKWDAYPLRDCVVPTPIKIQASGIFPSQVDLSIYERGGNDPFSVRPGTYKLGVLYTEISPSVQAFSKFKYQEATSNEFKLDRSNVIIGAAS